MTIETDFLNYSAQKLTELCKRVETCLGKLTADQLATLKTVFPGGVCDYSKPGVGQVPLAGTWLMYTSGAAPKSLASLN